MLLNQTSAPSNQIISKSIVNNLIFPEISNFEYYENQLFSDKEAEEPILTGKVAVNTLVEMDDGSYRLLVQTLNGQNQLKIELVESSSLTTQILAALLQKHGLVVQNPRSVYKFVTGLTAKIASQKAIQGIVKIGWNANREVFNTGSSLICSAITNPNDYYCQPVQKGLLRMSQKGSLSEWKQHIGVHIEANDMPLVFTCLSLASVLLDQALLSSSMFNLFGQHGTGKTLCLQLAATVWGNGIDPSQGGSYIQKASGTPKGLVALLATYSQLPTILDELGEQDTKHLDKFCYSTSSGAGGHKMTSCGDLADAPQWLSNVLISAEFSIAELIGKPLAGGEADRAADLPIPANGIFSDFGCHGNFNSLTRQLKNDTGLYFGSAGHTFIQYCLDNASDVTEILAELAVIEAKLAPVGCEKGQLRIVKRFALSYVAGIIAIDAGILDCDEQRIMEAHKLAVQLWWNQRANSKIQLANLLKSGRIQIVSQRPNTQQSSVVFRHGGLLTFESKLFERSFFNHESMLKELNSFDMIKREQPSRLVHRYCNNKFAGYSFLEEKLLPWLTPSDNQTTEQSLDDDFA